MPTGDLFGSRRCDCGPQLDEAMRRIATEGRGVVVYLRGHEGRGIGIGPKLQAYRLQELGFDTVDANLELGFPVDCRDFAVASWILADLGVSSVRMLTNNPAKCAGLAAHGTVILNRVALTAEPNPHNLEYLRTKQARLGHMLTRRARRAAGRSECGGISGDRRVGSSRLDLGPRLGAGPAQDPGRRHGHPRSRTPRRSSSP